MKYIKQLFVTAAIALFTTACDKDETGIDTEYPVIDANAPGTFPVQCSTVKRGEKFTFKAAFSDNMALGSYSLDIHHNFDHHTHSTEVSDCSTDPVKKPVNPFLLIKTFDIPESQKAYAAIQEIEVPADIDPGDYHFMIRLTDKEGWQTLRGISIKIQ
ncbi:DUF4625 domain-containing protein [Dyadobacter sediminis]|uniref:DUF4625 domain-containing protein n=1 Tax=Dyadobacter sediminis TaxID=1493691 RepID=A0A5R9KK17_9BACT|nr:DUF4625 domain-containing protein [Dyadobacter sediminis]TLU96567.1 DUF4625 domain-containing protein [Dyadobacter sediminis]GGB83296.1 hypothetical protein GCM10011325_08560 [Dyadobacter sediminis]